jgi:hypothetical protein
VLRIYNGYSYIVPGNFDALIYFDPQISYGKCLTSQGSQINLTVTYSKVYNV